MSRGLHTLGYSAKTTMAWTDALAKGFGSGTSKQQSSGAGQPATDQSSARATPPPPKKSSDMVWYVAAGAVVVGAVLYMLGRR